MESTHARTAVVLQPSYIPWRGYFDLIQRADVFVFYDDVQYDKHGWRNRNRIKTASGPRWLTIPVLSKGNIDNNLLIQEVMCDARFDWRHKHLEQIRHAYRKAPYFKETFSFLNELFASAPTDRLAEFTIFTTIAIAERLGLTGSFARSSELGVTGSKNDRLLQTLASVQATHYISGPSAKAYISAEAFAAAKIDLEYAHYDYEPYEQLHPPYEPQVSIIDLLFMQGSNAAAHLESRVQHATAV